MSPNPKVSRLGEVINKLWQFWLRYGQPDSNICDTRSFYDQHLSIALRHLSFPIHAVPMNRKPIDLPLERDEQPSSEKGMRLQWFEAASGGKFDEIITHLANGANVFWKDDQKCTSLHLAAGHGHKDVVQLLLSHGADVDAKNRFSETALHQAASNGHKAVVQVLLDADATVNEKDDHSRTALHKAAMNRYSEIVSLLLPKYKNVDEKSQNGKTFLAELSEIGDVEMATLMLNHGADIEALDSNGRTPFIIAAKSSHLDMISLLINKGANTDAIDNDSMTALHWSAKAGNVAVLKLLLQKIKKIDAITIDEDTALHVATEYDHLNIVITLLSYGASIDAENGKGNTPIKVAMLKRHREIEHHLKKARATKATKEQDNIPKPSPATDDREIELYMATPDMNEMTEKKKQEVNAALCRASCRGQVDLISRLLKSGADINAPNDDGLSPIFVAGQHPQVIPVLIDNGAFVDARNSQKRNVAVLHHYVSQGQIEALRILLSSGCNIHSTDDDFNTALHYAARKGNCEVAVLLLQKGIDINARNCRGESALHVALQNEFYELSQLLIERNIDIEAKTYKSESTALHIAIETKNSDLISLLVRRDANVQAKNALGETALHLAVCSELVKACAQLLENNADVHCKDKNDCTPLHVAVEKFNPALVSVLLKHGALAQRSNSTDNPLRHAINCSKYEKDSRFESRFIAVVKSLVEAGADTTRIDVPEDLEQRFPSLISILAESPFKSANDGGQNSSLEAASTTVEHYIDPTDSPEMVLFEFENNSDTGDKNSLVNKRDLNQIKHKYGNGWPSSTNFHFDEILEIEEGDRSNVYSWATPAKTVMLSNAKTVDDLAIAIIQALLDCFNIKLFISVHFFMLELQGGTDNIPPKWASEFDKMKGIIRDPGRLIVQIPTSKATLSVPAQKEQAAHPYLCFIDAVYACRTLSPRIDQEAFSDILGGSEQTLATDMHSILIAGLGILSIVGGDGMIEKLVEAILGIKLDPVHHPLQKDLTLNWQVLNRRQCPCKNLPMDYPMHRPLSPVAAAKSIGLDVWRSRCDEIVRRAWDLDQDELVTKVNVMEVIFITHRWSDVEIDYHDVMRSRIGQNLPISEMSDKLRRIRKSLLGHTKYVWIDTICIDKSNLSELDEAIRSMYKWYSNCAAVVLDSDTPLNTWCERGWCLIEGAAAGVLRGITKRGNLATIQDLALEQKQDLCTLDLHLYYRKGNAAEILKRMDVRKTTRVEDMAYALAGVFSIWLTLAYGEGIRSRERLLHELAIQKGDLSFLSFPTTQKYQRNYLPVIGETVYSITDCAIASVPITISHFGICLEVELVNGLDVSIVLRELKSWNLLGIMRGRSIGLENLIALSESSEHQGSLSLAIVHDIKSLILVQVYGLDPQTGGGQPIKLCYRLQCCQIESNEFDRLFNGTETIYERIWLGDGPSDTGTRNIPEFGHFQRRKRKR